MAYCKANPFNWGEVEEGLFKTTATLREASYSDAVDATFTENALESFFGNDAPPTPQIHRVCGINCPE